MLPVGVSGSLEYLRQSCSMHYYVASDCSEAVLLCVQILTIIVVLLWTLGVRVAFDIQLNPPQ
jgi:hypothetical protein